MSDQVDAKTSWAMIRELRAEIAQEREARQRAEQRAIAKTLSLNIMGAEREEWRSLLKTAGEALASCIEVRKPAPEWEEMQVIKTQADAVLAQIQQAIGK